MNDSSKCQFDLFDILRAHSRTSSSGVLSVRWDNLDLNLILNEGKIVGVDGAEGRLSNTVLERIAHRVSLSDSEMKSFFGANILNKSSQNLLRQNAGVLSHEIENIQRTVELEELQKFSSFRDGDFEFQLAIPDSSRSYVISISPGQFILDLVEQGFRIAITEEKEQEEEILGLKIEAPQPKVTEKKKGDSKSFERNWNDGTNTKTYIRMLNYYALTQEGAKNACFASGLSLILFCCWKIPIIFSVLVNALVDLVKV